MKKVVKGWGKYYDDFKVMGKFVGVVGDGEFIFIGGIVCDGWVKDWYWRCVVW